MKLLIDLIRGNKKSTEEINPYPFSLEELSDRFRMYNVPYNGKLCTIDWSRELLDDGNWHVQDGWVDLLHGQEFRLASSSEYYASQNGLYNNRRGPHSKLVQKMRSMFSDDFKKYWMMTSTRIRYNPSAPDTVVQGYNTPKEIALDVDFVGANGYIAGSSFEDELEALFGSRDPQEIAAVYKWASGKKLYLWHLNSLPSQVTERARVLGVWYDGRFVIDAVDVINSRRPARGVVVREESVPAPKKILPGALSLAPIEDLKGAVSIHSEEGGLSLTRK